jgi:hypothetical protein
MTIPLGTVPMNDNDQAILRELWRWHLRMPGRVKPAIVKILRLNSLTDKQIADARLEWLRLGGQAVPA